MLGFGPISSAPISALPSNGQIYEETVSLAPSPAVAAISAIAVPVALNFQQQPASGSANVISLDLAGALQPQPGQASASVATMGTASALQPQASAASANTALANGSCDVALLPAVNDNSTEVMLAATSLQAVPSVADTPSMTITSSAGLPVAPMQADNATQAHQAMGVMAVDPAQSGNALLDLAEAVDAAVAQVVSFSSVMHGNAAGDIALAAQNVPTSGVDLQKVADIAATISAPAYGEQTIQAMSGLQPIVDTVSASILSGGGASLMSVASSLTETNSMQAFAQAPIAIGPNVGGSSMLVANPVASLSVAATSATGSGLIALAAASLAALPSANMAASHIAVDDTPLGVDFAASAGGGFVIDKALPLAASFALDPPGTLNALALSEFETASAYGLSDVVSMQAWVQIPASYLAAMGASFDSSEELSIAATMNASAIGLLDAAEILQVLVPIFAASALSWNNFKFLALHGEIRRELELAALLDEARALAGQVAGPSEFIGLIDEARGLSGTIRLVIQIKT